MTLIWILIFFLIFAIIALCFYLLEEGKKLPNPEEKEEPKKPPDITSRDLKKAIRDEIEFKNMMSYTGDEQEKIELSIAKEISKRKK